MGIFTTGAGLGKGMKIDYNDVYTTGKIKSKNAKASICDRFY